MYTSKDHTSTIFVVCRSFRVPVPYVTELIYIYTNSTAVCGLLCEFRRRRPGVLFPFLVSFWLRKFCCCCRRCQFFALCLVLLVLFFFVCCDPHAFRGFLLRRDRCAPGNRSTDPPMRATFPAIFLLLCACAIFLGLFLAWLGSPLLRLLRSNPCPLAPYFVSLVSCPDRSPMFFFFFLLC